jgi:hypothetical protein
MFTVTKNSNYKEFIEFENSINTEVQLSSSVVLRKNIEIDLLFNSSKGVEFKYEHSKQYSLVLEATRFCQYSNKVVYILRQINVHDVGIEEEDDDIVTDSHDDVVYYEDICGVYDELNERLQTFIKSKTEQVGNVESFLKESEGISIVKINKMNELIDKYDM